MVDEKNLPAQDEGDEFPDLMAGDPVPGESVIGDWTEEIDEVDLDEHDETEDDG